MFYLPRYYFFWPLGTARKAMQNAKDEELLLLAQAYNMAYEQVKQEASAGNSGSNKKEFEGSIENLDNLKKLYTVASEFPVWPFDIQNLRRFAIIVTTPLIPALVSILTELLKSVVL